MKDQYFGDVRDLFKYDLIEKILEGVSPLEKRFTFIPMLTNGESKSGDGNKRDFKSASDDSRPGTKNSKLVHYLEKYKNSKERKITEIKGYFEPEVVVDIYKEDALFDHKSRDAYFAGIRAELLSSPLIFLDPDNGLQVKGSNKRHLLYSEVKMLCELMGKDSILMIFQYFPRDRSILEYLPSGRAATLKDKLPLNDIPLYISDNEICFLFLTKNGDLRKKLVEILSEYIDKYKSFFLKLKVSNIGPDII